MPQRDDTRYAASERERREELCGDEYAKDAGIDYHQGGTVKLNPLADRLLVQVLEEEEVTAAGIIIPDNAREKPMRGKVLAVGPGGRTDSGDRIPIDVEVGDEIVFSKYGGTEVSGGIVNTKEVLLLREADVLAVFDK
jgi:chaperonin GroES